MTLPLTGVAGAVDDRDIAGKDAGAGHALALDADREGGGRMLDQQLVKIERPVDIVLGRRRKSRSGRPGHHRHAQRRADLDIDKGGDIALPLRGQLARQIGDCGTGRRTALVGVPRCRPAPALAPPCFISAIIAPCPECCTEFKIGA